MHVDSFSEALISVYVENPCGAQAEPLWKTLREIRKYRNNFELENSMVNKLMLWNDLELRMYWDRNSYYIDIERDKLSRFKKIILHETQLSSRINKMFSNKAAFFRIKHNLDKVSQGQLSEDYYFMKVKMPEEAQTISELFNKCCENFKPEKEEIISWTSYPVYNNNLWIWIMNKRNNKPVGLGIAMEDYRLKEGAVEYLLVLPEYRNIGLGKELLLELIYSLKDSVTYVTAAGKVDNPYNMEGLLRKCGFTGKDIWYVINP